MNRNADITGDAARVTMEESIRYVTPYTPGEQPKYAVAKLNTNENPYPPSPEVAKVLRSFETDTLRLYPDPTCSSLVNELAGYHGVDPDHVFVGVGSDDVLALSFLTFFNSDRPILFPDITYSFYDVWAGLYRIPFERVPLTDDFRIDPNDYASDCGGIIFPNPNAPTGICTSIADVEKIVSAHPGCIVIVDEAYIDFGGESAIPLTKKYDNLVVVRTFSKSRSMAGMRIGYAVGCRHLMNALRNVKFAYNSYTLTNYVMEAGVASIRDEAYFTRQIERICSTREKTTETLKKMGFTVLPSCANFVFAGIPGQCMEPVYDRLRKEGIYVRYFSGERTKDYLRITIGTEEEMEILFSALRQDPMIRKGLTDL